jgi:uncharacterized protein YjdB
MYTFSKSQSLQPTRIIEMRRIVLLGFVLVTGCLSTPTPHLTNSINLTVTAQASGVFPGDTFTVIGTPLDGAGNIVPIDTVIYSSSNTSVATVTSAGLVVALAPGSTNIVATADGHFSRFPLNVDGNVTASVFVTPPTPTISVGAQAQLTVTIFTTLNNAARNKTVTWSTSDATKATVNATGNVSAVAATAAVSICATANDAPTIKGCATVKVQ